MVFDYVKETELTASGMDGRVNCDRYSFVRKLREFKKAGEELNLYKKVLFRGRLPEEVGVGLPFDGDSLDKHTSMEDIDFIHGIVGICTEAAELAELLIDAVESDEPIDKLHVQEELGDVLWYQARLVKYCNTTFEDEMVRNIRKLRARHGNKGFDATKDINRDLENERNVLEGTQPE